MEERAGALDYLFNNAGISMGGPTHELTGDHWDLRMAATAVADLVRPAADPDDPFGGPAAPVDRHPHPR